MIGGLSGDCHLVRSFAAAERTPGAMDPGRGCPTESVSLQSRTTEGLVGEAGGLVIRSGFWTRIAGAPSLPNRLVQELGDDAQKSRWLEGLRDEADAPGPAERVRIMARP